jgi:outer membrane usher protein
MRGRARAWAFGAALIVLSAIGCSGVRADPTATAPTSPAMAEEENLILSLSINGEQVEDSVITLERRGQFYLPVATLAAHRVTVPATATRVAGPGGDFVSLADLPAVTAQYDSARQDLGLRVPPSAMDRQVVDLSRTTKLVPQPSAAGAYLNYDATAQTTGAANSVAALVDAGSPVFGGDLSSAEILRVGASGDPSASSASAFVRLDTTFSRQFEDDLTELKIGDSISRGGSWGNPLRFGGLQYGKDFTVQPGFVAYPTANFAGQAALPSTVDLYVNDALRYRGNVSPGPFQLNQIPAITGRGDAQIVLTDALGRQQSVALPFYVDSGLLRQGLSDFSYEAGFLRDDYALSSNHYGAAIASATYRYGLSDSHTVEGHVEATTERRAVGGSLTSVVTPLGEFQEEVALGNGPGGTGWLAGASFSHQTSSWSVNFRQVWQTRSFDAGAISFATTDTKPRAESQAELSVNLGDFGSLALSAIRQRYETEATATVASAALTMPIDEQAFVNVYALNTHQGERGTTVGMTLTFLFDGSTSATLDASSQSGQFLGTAQFRHTPVGPTGWDYGATVSTGTVDHGEADVTDRTASGDFGAAVDEEQGTSSGRLNASGGLVFVGGKIFASRRLNDAFGLVSVPGYAGVTVYQDNRPIGVTDQDGDLFVPTLLPNNINHLSVASADLPVDVDIDALDAEIIPAYRGIANVEFRAKPRTQRLIVLTRKDGSPVDAGIAVDRVSDGQVFRAGYGGEVYLGGQTGEGFLARDTKGDCRFRLPAAIGDTVPTLICDPAS